MLIELAGNPPPRIMSSFSFPVSSRARVPSSDVADFITAPIFGQELLHRGDEPVLGDRLEEEPVRPRLPGTDGGGEDAHDEDARVARLRVGLELPAEREPVDPRDQDLG